jgi:hypothetical protein
MEVKDVELLFGEPKEQHKEIFQTLFYSLIMQQNGASAGIEPALYFLRELYKPEFDHCIKYNGAALTDATPLLPQFTALLQNLIAAIFDPQKPFVQTDDDNACKYCAFAAVCGR